jgi:hypothetical protein
VGYCFHLGFLSRETQAGALPDFLSCQQAAQEQEGTEQEEEHASDQTEEIGSGEVAQGRSEYDSLLAAAPNTPYPIGNLDKTGQLDEKKWHKASSEYDFTEHPPKEKFSSTKKRGGPLNWGKFQWKYWEVLFKYGSFGIVSLVLAYLIFLLLKDTFKQAETAKESLISWETDPEKISFALLDDWLQQSLLKKDYAQGVRILFLITLKELSSRSIIKWKRNKTNRDYLLEIQDEMLLPPYRYLSFAFDAALYGHYPVTENAFQKCREQFEKFSFQQKESKPS